jgi:hypothetical protein
VLEWWSSLRSCKASRNCLAKSLSEVKDQSGYTKVIVICPRCQQRTEKDIPPTRHAKVSSCLTHPRSQVDLLATPPDTLRLAAASRIHVRRSTYLLHHQTRQSQQWPRVSTFAGQLTYYSTRHAKVSSCLAHLRSQVNLLATPPDTLRLAAASRTYVRRSTYCLHHQTR